MGILFLLSSSIDKKLDKELIKAIELLDSRINESYVFYSHQNSEFLDKKLNEWNEKLNLIKKEVLYVEDEF